MLTYSIAIRTLGTGGEKFRKELYSIARQTVQPERVMVYIAEGYARPNFTIGKEEYVWVRKGMVAQRVLPYHEIASDCILMLDDDVMLAPDSAERMLVAMDEQRADCVGADTFKNQDLSVGTKVYAAVTNLVFPHYSEHWAFKIHRNGSFSYNNHPRKSFYWSQSCAGPAMLWRKFVYEQLHLEDELWLDSLEFAYGEDITATYKLHKNGFRLGVLFDSGIENLDGGTSSDSFRKSPQRMYVRSKAQFLVWWRTCYNLRNTTAWNKGLTAFCFMLKAVWLCLVMCGVALVRCRPAMLTQYLKGLKDGWKFVHTTDFHSLRNYIVSEHKTNF